MLCKTSLAHYRAESHGQNLTSRRVFRQLAIVPGLFAAAMLSSMRQQRRSLLLAGAFLVKCACLQISQMASSTGCRSRGGFWTSIWPTTSSREPSSPTCQPTVFSPVESTSQCENSMHEEDSRVRNLFVVVPWLTVQVGKSFENAIREEKIQSQQKPVCLLYLVWIYRPGRSCALRLCRG